MNMLDDLGDSKLTKEDIGYDYIVDLYYLLINNMINYTNNDKDFTLKENLLLFSILTDYITLEVDTNTNDDAIDNLGLLYEAYLKFLCNHYDTTLSYLERISNKLEKSYYSVVDVCNPNVCYGDEYRHSNPSGSDMVQEYSLLSSVLHNYDCTNVENASYSRILRND